MAAETDLSSLTAAEVAAVRTIARLARVAEGTLHDLSLAHYRVLSAIASGDERASRVAAKFSLGKPTVSAVVDALCRNGLVTKSAAGDDQRATALALTDEGRRVLDRAEHALVAVLRGLAESGPQLRCVVETLAAVGAALEDQAQARDEKAGRGAGAGNRDRAGTGVA